MNNTTKKILIPVVVIIAIAIFGIVAAKNLMSKKPDANKTEAQTIAKDDNAETSIAAANLLKVLKTDIIFGDEKAPVTIIEYASLSCTHCATFYTDGLTKLKAEYIDAGKVKYIYRDFPLNQPALIGAKLALCIAEDNKNDVVKYYDFLKALFKTQDGWAFQENFIEKLKSITKLDGMSSERFDSCIKDNNLQERILKSRLEVSKVLQIQSTPTFFVNGEIINVYSGYDSIKKIIDKKLTSADKK